MTQEVGDAILAYIKDGRHPIDNDTLFIRARAPFGPFASHCAISVLVAKAMHLAGVRCPNRGAAHVLRNSVASSMLRQGASLHRSRKTIKTPHDKHIEAPSRSVGH